MMAQFSALDPAEEEEEKAQLTRAEIEAMYTIAIFVNDIKGQEDAMEDAIDVDSEVSRMMEPLILAVENSSLNRLRDLVKSEPVNSLRLGKVPALHRALRTLISSKDHPSRCIAAECMALLIQKAPSLPITSATLLVRARGALECLWSIASDADELPSWSWISIVMSRAQPVECPWNRQDLSSLVPMMMSRAIQSQQGELILQLTRVMGGLAVQACADYCSEETTLSATETRAWKDVLTGLWGRAYHYRSAKKVDVPASEMREVVAKLRKKGARDQVLVDAFKEMLSEEDIVLPAEQMAEAVALSLAKGERDGLLLLTGVLWSDYVLDRQKAKSFCAKILSTGHVVKALVECLDVTHEASQADNEVLQKASDAAQTLMYLNKHTDQGVPLGCDTIVELVRFAECQNKEDERLKRSLISLTDLLLGLTPKLFKKRLIEFVEAYYAKFPGGPPTPPPSGEKGAAKALRQAAQKFQERAREFYSKFSLGKRLEDAFPRLSRDASQINIASLAKLALILGLSGSAECVLKELGQHSKKHSDNVEKDFKTTNKGGKQERQELDRRIERLAQNIRFFESPKEKHLKAFKSIWASYSPASTLTLADVGGGSPNPPTLPPSSYLALLAPPIPPAPLAAVPVEFTQGDFNTKFAERVILVEGCDRQAHL